MIEILPLTVRLRDADLLRAVCRRRGWEFRDGQQHYRWFGRWLDDQPLPPGLTPAELGRCTHAIGVPGCRYEIGLVWRDDHYLPLWDDGPGGGLADALGPGGGLFWQACVSELVRRTAFRRRLRVSRSTDNAGTLRLRVTARRAAAVMHVRVARDGAAALWVFGPAGPQSQALADALGEVRIDEITTFDADPAGDPPAAVHP